MIYTLVFRAKPIPGLADLLLVMTSQLKEIDYLKTWALFFLCATIGGFVVGAVAGGILGGTLGAVGASARTIRFLCAGAGFIASLPVSYLCFRFAVSRFLVPKITGQTPQSGADVFKQAA